MKPRKPEAERLERDYLDRLRRILTDQPHAAGIVESVAEHIEEAAGECKTPEISLVQMAQILERLGTPESFVPPEHRSSLREEVGTAPSRSGLATEAADLMDRVWLGSLIGVVGLFVPLIDLLICELISCVMLALAFGSWAYDRPAGFRKLSGLCWWCFVLSLLICPLGVLGLAVPLTGLLTFPVAIGHFALALVIYWKTMTGAADLVREEGGADVGSSILRTRDTYVWVAIGYLIFAMVVGVAIGLACGRNRRDALIAQAIIPLCLLPISWALGWHFILRPLNLARQYLRKV